MTKIWDTFQFYYFKKFFRAGYSASEDEVQESMSAPNMWAETEFKSWQQVH